MNSDVKKKWVDKLKNGGLSQTNSALKTPDGHCCLGVLCEVYSEEVGGEWEENSIDNVDGEPLHCYSFLDSATVLPVVVMEWAELDETNPCVVVENYNTAQSYETSLAELNDDEGRTFEEIADIIESEL